MKILNVCTNILNVCINIRNISTIFRIQLMNMAITASIEQKPVILSTIINDSL